MHRIIMYTLAFFISTSGFPKGSKALPKPYDKKIAVLGDSLSVGIFAASGGVRSYERQEEYEGYGFFKKLILSLIARAHEYSYVEGYRINSIKERLQNKGHNVFLQRYAISGHETKDVLIEQIPKMKEDVEYIGGKYDYTFLLVGANDLCADIPILDVKINMAVLYSELENLSHKTFIVPLPQIYKLHETVAEGRGFLFLPIKFIWRIHDLCPRLTHDGLILRQANKEYVEEYNRAIEQVVGDSDSLIVTENVENLEFTKTDVSRIDGFHASKYGQEKLADIVWPYTLREIDE